MSRLTERRLRKAIPILEEYRDKFYRHLRFDTGLFEMELRDCLNLGYQGFKGVVKDMLRMTRYKYLALYYMENSNAPGPVSEFWGPLAKAYGVRFYRAPDMEKKRSLFWDKFANLAKRKVLRKQSASAAGGTGG